MKKESEEEMCGCHPKDDQPITCLQLCTMWCVAPGSAASLNAYREHMFRMGRVEAISSTSEIRCQ